MVHIYSQTIIQSLFEAHRHTRQARMVLGNAMARHQKHPCWFWGSPKKSVPPNQAAFEEKNKVGYLFTIAGSLRSTQEQQRSITGSTSSFPLSLSLLVNISNIPYAAKFQLLWLFYTFVFGVELSSSNILLTNYIANQFIEMPSRFMR